MHWRLDKYVCVVCDGFTQEIIKVREWIPHTGLLTKVIFSNMVPSPSADITRAMHGQEKWRSRNYNPRQKSWHAYPLLQYLSEKFISSPPSPRFNVIYRDVFVIARFQHCRGGGGRGGVLYSSDVISYCFKIPCQRMFQLSDPDVPKTFVVDCTRDELAWTSLCMFWFCFMSEMFYALSAVFFVRRDFR